MAHPKRAETRLTEPALCIVYKTQSLVDGGFRVSLDLSSRDLELVRFLMGKSGQTVCVSFVEGVSQEIPEIDLES